MGDAGELPSTIFITATSNDRTLNEVTVISVSNEEEAISYPSKDCCLYRIECSNRLFEDVTQNCMRCVPFATRYVRNKLEMFRNDSQHKRLLCAMLLFHTTGCNQARGAI